MWNAIHGDGQGRGKDERARPQPRGRTESGQGAREGAKGGRADAGVEPATRRQAEPTELVTKSTKPLYGTGKQENARAAKPPRANGVQTRRQKTPEKAPGLTQRGTDPAKGQQTPETRTGFTNRPEPKRERRRAGPRRGTTTTGPQQRWGTTPHTGAAQPRGAGPLDPAG